MQHDGAPNNRVLKLAANWRRPVNPGGYYWGVSAYQSEGGGPGALATKAYLDRYAGWGILGSGRLAVCMINGSCSTSGHSTDALLP